VRHVQRLQRTGEGWGMSTGGASNGSGSKEGGQRRSLCAWPDEDVQWPGKELTPLQPGQLKPWRVPLLGEVSCGRVLGSIFCPCCVTYEMVKVAASFQMAGLGIVVVGEAATFWSLMVWGVGGVLTAGG